ncbi:50S ribosomal protein L20 [bacterium]|nr:50S ribosomal protein L20 [bacterium]
MPRVKGGFKTRKRRKKVLKATEGYRGSAKRSFSKAYEALTHALVYAFRDRKNKKRDMRALWNQRINAAARENELTYSTLIGGLKRANVELDRKTLAYIALHDPQGFSEIAKAAQGA